MSRAQQENRRHHSCAQKLAGHSRTGRPTGRPHTVSKRQEGKHRLESDLEKTGTERAQDRVMMKRNTSEMDNRKDGHTKGQVAASRAGRSPGGEHVPQKPREEVS